MKAPAIPLNEAERQAALCALELLDTPPEERFDRITRIAQRHFGVQMALVSLVDGGRQWFKSRQGLAAPETPRDISFCGHAILTDDILQVPNALTDPHFADNPLVTGGPEIRFYAGAPLHAPGGERVGTLCIIDGRPRQMSAEDLALLRDLADCVEAELEHAQLRETELQLRTAKQRLSAVIDTVLDGIVTIDARGTVQSYNPAAERIFGYKGSEVVGRNVNVLMPEPDRSQHDGYIERYRASGKRRAIGATIEATGRRRDGSMFPLEVAVNEMAINGECMFTGIVRDITERKHDQLQLARSAKELTDFKAALDQHAIVVTTDARGTITYVNDRFCTISQYARDELIGQNHRIINSGHHPPAFFSALWQTIGRGRIWRGEIKNRARDGTFYWVETTIVPFLDDHGKPVQYIAIRTDITERKQVTAVLSEKERLLSETQRIAHIGAWSWDLKGSIHWTQEMYQLYGVTPETFTPTAESFVGLLHPQDRPAMVAWLTACAAGEKPGELEFRTSLSDGTVRHLSGHGETVFDAQNEPIQMAGTVQDITARKQAMQTIIDARAAAELANRAKDSFLATMSHEIRTPLGGLLGMLELLSLSPLKPEQGETLQAARDSGRSLLRILNDILDWSKIEEGKLELAPQATSIAALVAEVVNTYSHVASGNSVTLGARVDARLSPVHLVDPLRLSQVLNNFLSNAIKFSHGGRVELRADLVARTAGAEEVRFSVQDTGIGIDPQAQQRLFQSYGQASADTSRMYGGTGLGLAICRRLADLMEGRIELESMPGRGSTFSITLTLPIAPGAVPNRASPAESVAAAAVPPFVAGLGAAGQALVLVVDDHPLNRRLLVLQLALLGLPAETAENGELALALWRSGRYALVITDCHMPVLDGYALTRAIRASEAAQGLDRTPVFAWTANALADEVENCHRAGMDELLVKPTDLAQLKQVLVKWLPATPPVAAPPPVMASAARQSMQPTAVDVSVLAALIGDDPATLREFLLDFAASAKAIATELLAACAGGDAAQAGALAHKLKSSARSVGALALGNLCAEIEAAARAGQTAILAELARQFQTDMTSVDAALGHLTRHTRK